jgi:hypothetical protein
MKQNSFKLLFSSLCIILFACSLAFTGTGMPVQHKKELPLRCTKATLQLMKAIPKLNYSCADRDEDNLKNPERKQALRRQIKELEQFTSQAWWAANVTELNICAEFKKPYVLHDHEFYTAAIYGDSHTRLVITDDPCVKYSYGTLNVFVLQRTGNRVVVTQVLDSYFSRADNAISLQIADMGSQRILEINARTGGLQPYATSFLYAIDKRTNRAVPKKLIKDGKTFTNEMTSCDALGIWVGKFEIELPESWKETTIIKNGRLADKFYVYHKGIDTLERAAFQWNGRYYEIQQERVSKRQH